MRAAHGPRSPLSALFVCNSGSANPRNPHEAGERDRNQTLQLSPIQAAEQNHSRTLRHVLSRLFLFSVRPMSLAPTAHLCVRACVRDKTERERARTCIRLSLACQVPHPKCSPNRPPALDLPQYFSRARGWTGRFSPAARTAPAARRDSAQALAGRCSKAASPRARCGNSQFKSNKAHGALAHRHDT